MDLTDLHLFNMAKRRLDWVAQRQTVLAENISNADTPQYQPKDIKEATFKQLVAETLPNRVRMAVTQPGHTTGQRPPAGPFDAREQRRTYEASPDGNQVVLEEQMQKLTENRGRYETSISLVERYSRMLRIALGKG